MELLQLRYFVEVARTQHVTKSARRLHVSQPTVTQSIHRLESELGEQLFEHAGRGIRLTRCGKIFLERIEPALSLIDDAERSVRSFQRKESDTIRMDVLAASALTVDAIASYSALHPSVRFQISHTAGEEESDIVVSTPLSRHETHGENPVGTASEAHAGDALDIKSFSERIMLAVPTRSYPGCDELSLADVAEEKFILLAGSKNLRDVCDALCAQHGFAPTAVFESDNPSVVRKMIGLGLGVGFWPEKSWGSCNEDGARLVALKEDGFARSIEIRLESRAENTEARPFYDFLVSYFETAWM